MINLKNIRKVDGNILCDAFPEDCGVPVPLVLNVKNETVSPYTLPDGYEWCMSHIEHAKRFLLSVSDKLPKEFLLMWY